MSASFLSSSFSLVCARGGIRTPLVLAAALFAFPPLRVIADSKIGPKRDDAAVCGARISLPKASEAKECLAVRQDAKDNNSLAGLHCAAFHASSASNALVPLDSSAKRLNGLYMFLFRRGVSWQFRGDLEGFANARGGIETGVVGSSTVVVNLRMDTRKLFGLRGGTFNFGLYDHAGRNPTTALVGGAQPFDRFNFRPFFEIYSLWYQQRFFDGRLRLLAGKVDANTLFGVVSNGSIFLNSSAQVDPTNFLFPTFPAPMPAVNALYSFKNGFYAGFGLYDSNSSVHFLNFNGHPQSVQPVTNGLFAVGESGLTWKSLFKSRYDGDLRAGFWGHTGTLTQFNGQKLHGVQGMYFILDQTLWKPPSISASEGRGLRTFFECGQSDAAVASIDRHYGAGLTWTGLSPSRSKDVAGFGPEYAVFSPQQPIPYRHELALEIFYKAQMTNHFAVHPDLQYIQHPSGKYPSAFVTTLRLQFLF